MLVAVVGVFAALHFRQPPAVQKRAEPVLAVRAVVAETGDYAPALFLIGKVEALDYARLTAPAEMEVEEIFVREGDFFPADKRLLLLDRRDLIYSARALDAGISELRADLTAVVRNRESDAVRLRQTRRLLELAHAAHERNLQLVDAGVISAETAESSERDLLQRRLEITAVEKQIADYLTQRRRLEARLEAAAALLSQAQLLLERSEMRAPFAGRVSEVHTAVGARPPRGGALLDIFDPAKLRLRVTVPQKYARLSDGARALLEVGGEMLTLSFAGLEPRVDSGNSGVDAFFPLPRGDWVLGVVRDVTVDLPPLRAAAVPVDALYNDKFIYRVDADGRAEAMECETRGLTRVDGVDGGIAALVDCPALADGDLIVANQLPNLLGGVKLTVIAEQ